MREASLSEYLRVTSKPHAVKRQMNSKRCTDTEWKHCGITIAHKTETLSRGKVVSTTYYINPAYLENT